MTKAEYKAIDSYLRHRAMHGDDWEFEDWRTWHQNHNGTVSRGGRYVAVLECAELERRICRAYLPKPTDTEGARLLCELQREICCRRHAKHLQVLAELRPQLP